MARLRYNGLSGTLGAAHNDSTTTLTLASKLTHEGGDVPTISGDYIPLSILDSDGNCAEIVHITAYTTGATSATVTRGAEGTTASAHDNGATFVNGPTVWDMPGQIGIDFPLTRTWASDGYNGIFAAIAEARGINTFAPWKFANPAVEAPVRTPGGPPATLSAVGFSVSASQSSTIDSYRLAYRAFDQVNTENGDAITGGDVHTGNGANEWWKVDVGDGYELTLTRIGILGRATGNFHPRNFKIQGSNDNSSWTDLLTVTGDGPGNNTWWSSAVVGAAAYRYIRVYMTGNNSSASAHLVMGDVEMWGTLDAA